MAPPVRRPERLRIRMRKAPYREGRYGAFKVSPAWGQNTGTRVHSTRSACSLFRGTLERAIGERALLGKKVGARFKRLSPSGADGRGAFGGLLGRDTAQPSMEFQTAEVFPIERQSPRQCGRKLRNARGGAKAAALTVGERGKRQPPLRTVGPDETHPLRLDGQRPPEDHVTHAVGVGRGRRVIRRGEDARSEKGHA